MNNPTAPSATDVFISYSSEDRDKINPIVQLVRVIKKDSVFQDSMSIRPGKQWADEIMKALEHCETVLVFWCEHSAASNWVRQEYEAGIAAKKEIIPVLLDDTEVPDPLRAYQWLDFRRDEPHGGLLSFVPRVFQRSGLHYMQTGAYHDWEAEHFNKCEFERKQNWLNTQATRNKDFAISIVVRLRSKQCI